MPKKRKPAPTLYGDLDERRRRLVNAGCIYEYSPEHELFGWKLPDGKMLMEAEALAWLAKQEGKGDA